MSQSAFGEVSAFTETPPRQLFRIGGSCRQPLVDRTISCERDGTTRTAVVRPAVQQTLRDAAVERSYPARYRQQSFVQAEKAREDR